MKGMKLRILSDLFHLKNKRLRIFLNLQSWGLKYSNRALALYVANPSLILCTLYGIPSTAKTHS